MRPEDRSSGPDFARVGRRRPTTAAGQSLDSGRLPFRAATAADEIFLQSFKKCTRMYKKAQRKAFIFRGFINMFSLERVVGLSCSDKSDRIQKIMTTL